MKYQTGDKIKIKSETKFQTITYRFKGRDRKMYKFFHNEKVFVCFESEKILKYKKDKGFEFKAIIKDEKTKKFKSMIIKIIN